MTLDEALAALADPQDALPEAALRWIDAHWAEVGVDLVTGCAAFLDGEDVAFLNDRSFFFALHLCAARGATRLHAPLCSFLLDAEATDELLGDAVTDTLRSMLISTFDGDLAPMQAVIESASSDEFAVDTALMALAYLTHAGRIPQAVMQAYLAHIFATIPREPDMLWVGYVMAVAALGLQTLEPTVETLFREGSVPRDYMRLADFRQDLADRLADPSGSAVFDAQYVAPLTDAIAALAKWHSFAERPQRRAGTIVNEMRDIGRNDPCPCGSGKKYKKCCLKAA